jgi:formylglycine-generating enzyme required for sulfatase activity
MQVEGTSKRQGPDRRVSFSAHGVKVLTDTGRTPRPAAYTAGLIDRVRSEIEPGARGDREQQMIRRTSAVFVKWLVIGTLVGSASVWLIDVSRPPAVTDDVANSAAPSEPPAGAVAPGQSKSTRVLVSDGVGAQCGTCVRLSHAPTSGRFASEAELLSPRRGRPLGPKDTFKDCDKCPEMVIVQAGKFNMGSSDSEQVHDPDERPQHGVKFTTPFAVGRFAVTFEEWDACVADGGCGGHRPPDHDWGRGRRPVTNVSWDDANTYTAWLSEKTGWRYRLLSEAEREYVTRAGRTSVFWWGSSISTSQANYDGDFTYGDDARGEYRGKTLVVDAFLPNPWGLYQTHGNVYEWVEDCYHESYVGAPVNGAAWVSGDCIFRVARGGSWLDDPISLRAAHRLRLPATTRFRNLGLRVARVLIP